MSCDKRSSQPLTPAMQCKALVTWSLASATPLRYTTNSFFPPSLRLLLNAASGRPGHFTQLVPHFPPGSLFFPTWDSIPLGTLSGNAHTRSLPSFTLSQGNVPPAQSQDLSTTHARIPSTCHFSESAGMERHGARVRRLRVRRRPASGRSARANHVTGLRSLPAQGRSPAPRSATEGGSLLLFSHLPSVLEST